MSSPLAGHRSISPNAPSAERQQPAWLRDASLPAHPPLREDLRRDVCVIGAGIAGLTSAYLLQKSGRSTVVIDDRDIGAGQTHRSSAHLSCVIDDRFTEIERVHGEDGARLAAQSHRAAIDLIETLARDERIDCGFARVDGYLFLGGDTTLEELAREAAAARRAGLEVSEVGALPLSAGVSVPALRFPRQAQFQPLRYLAGLAVAFERLGGLICGSSRASSVAGGTPATVEANGQRIECDAIVVATNSPVNDRTVIHTKQAPYTTYVIALEMAQGAVPAALYWDTVDPYHYVRVAAGDEATGQPPLLIVGGEDHKTGQADDKEQRFRRLADWAGRTFGIHGEPAWRWSGQVMETLDGLGFIGRNPLDRDNVFLITGDSGMGLTHGTLGAMIVSDLINGLVNPWAALYDPSRKPLATLKTFAEENINVALQMRDWLTPGEVSSPEQIARGSGAVVREGLQKQAVYRDDEGALHRCSAVCPHLGCIVRWNGVEGIWDCPCHGSRFDPFGKVVTGPSRADLAALD